MLRAALYTIRVEAVNPYHYLGEDGTGLISQTGRLGRRGGRRERERRRGAGGGKGSEERAGKERVLRPN